MRAAVLIAGSLAWDPTALRDAWRRERLLMESGELVTAPLRYGRCSSSRDDTYTMVFSSSCVARGVGLAVPFRRGIEVPEHLVEEAEALWSVESGRPRRSGRVSANWGSVVLHVNPNRPIAPAWLAAWQKVTYSSPGYGQLSVADGEAPVLEPTTGLATFPWPNVADSGSPLDLDALLLTATDPSIVSGRYPSVATVARAWKAHPSRKEYFLRNRKLGIQTADDSAIESLLTHE